MHITGLDHLVLTVSDIERSIAFYTQVLGMELISFGEGRKALRFGNQKMNLHEAGRGYTPKADKPLPGSEDVCFLLAETLQDAIAELEHHGVDIVDGPVKRTGAQGPIDSIYIRDPDGNLIELAVRQDDYLSM